MSDIPSIVNSVRVMLILIFFFVLLHFFAAQFTLLNIALVELTRTASVIFLPGCALLVPQTSWQNGTRTHPSLVPFGGDLLEM